MKFLHDIELLQASDDLTSEMALVLVNNIVKKRNLGDLYLKGLTMNMPNIFNPVTATATPAASTLTFSLANQTAKSVFAAPIANNGTPTFRALTLADVQDFYTSVDKTQLNYWTLTGSDVYRDTGNVYIGHSSSLGAYKLQVSGGTSYFDGNMEVTENRTIKLGAGTNITFTDKRGIYPTSAASAFVWDLNNDSARIYAQQPSGDNIDFVFQISDNAAATDRFVFWVKEWSGAANDRYPLYMDATKSVFNYINHFNGGAGGSGSAILAHLKSGVTSVNSANSMIYSNPANNTIRLNDWVGIGTDSSTTAKLYIGGNLGGNPNTYGIRQESTIMSTVTNAVYGYRNVINTEAATFTLGTYFSFIAEGGTLGAGSTITNAHGFYVANTIGTVATNAFGFNGQIAAGANKWNLYMAGTANNYMAGALGIGTTGLSVYNLNIARSGTGGVNFSSVQNGFTGLSDVTGSLKGFFSQISTQAATYTVSSITHFEISQGTFGAGSTVTSQNGFYVTSNFIGATNNYGFRGTIPFLAGANRYNLYLDGSAWNYMAGSLGIGNATLTNFNLRVNKGITGSITSYGITHENNVLSDVTGAAYVYMTNVGTQAATFTLGVLYHNMVRQGTFGAGSTVTSQYAYFADSNLIGATNNFGFRADIPFQTGANRWNFYASGTAYNYFNGNTLIGSNVPVGSSKLQVTGDIYGSTLAGTTTMLKTVAGVITRAVDGTDYYSPATIAFANYWTLASGNVYRATGKVFINSASDLGAYNLQVTGASYFTLPNSNFTLTDDCFLYGANSRTFKILSDDSGNNFQVGDSANPFSEIILYNQLKFSHHTGGLLKTDATGLVDIASAADIATLLGTAASGNYIQNQFAAAQSGSFWISGQARIDGYFHVNSSVPTIQISRGGVAKAYIGVAEAINSFATGTAIDDVVFRTQGGALHFVTNGGGSSAMYINSSQNVGIGTTNPLERLHVNGRILVTGDSYSVSPTGTILGKYATGVGYIQSPDNGDLQIWNGPTTAITVWKHDGTVLIGNNATSNYTSVSEARLQVNGGILQRGFFNGLVYANGNGTFVAATAANIAATLGAGNYIQNQYSSAQSASAWISGTFTSGILTSSYADLSGGAPLVFSSSTTQDIWSKNGGTIRIVDSAYANVNFQIDQLGNVTIRGNAVVTGTNYLGLDANNYYKPNDGVIGSHINTSGGFRFFTSGVERLYLTNDGKVLIGTTSPTGTWKLQVNSGSTSGNGLYVSGKIYATDMVTSMSDKRQKKSITDLVIGNRLDRINIKRYKFRKATDGRFHIGVLAQDFESIFPELVDEQQGIKSFDYLGLSAVALGLGLETKKRVDSVEQRVKTLEEENKQLKTQITQLLKQTKTHASK